MCLSKVYANKIEADTLLLSNIQKINFDDDSVIFTDLLERETRIKGRLLSADLVGGKVIVETHDQ